MEGEEEEEEGWPGMMNERIWIFDQVDSVRSGSDVYRTGDIAIERSGLEVFFHRENMALGREYIIVNGAENVQFCSTTLRAFGSFSSA